MSSNILSFLTTVQTLHCVHRNYSKLSRAQRIIRGLILLFEIILTCSSTLVQVYNRFLYGQYHDIIYHVLNILNSAAVVVSILYYSKQFQALLECIQKNHVVFSKDKIYIKNINRVVKSTIFLVVFTILSAFPSAAQIFLRVDKIRYSAIIDAFVLVMYNIRYLMTHILLFTLLNILSEQVNYMTRRLSEERGIPSSAISEEIVLGEQEVTNFDEWTKIYEDIKKCSNLINSIFGLQITISLAVSLFINIICWYSLINISVHENVFKTISLLIIWKIFIHQLALYILSRSAQKVQNSVEELKRRLGRLLIITLSKNIQDYKANINFLRLLTNMPIRTHGYGFIDINMMLIPKFIMVFTTYTVMALQINNVV